MRGRLLLCVGASGLPISPYNPRAQFGSAAVRHKQQNADLYHGGMFGERKISDVPEGEPPIIHKGDLKDFAVVAGARLYQPFLFIDNIAGINDVDYSQLFEDIPLELAHRDAKLHRDAARKAEVFMRRSLNRSYNFAMRGDHPIKLPDEFLDASDQKSDHLGGPHLSSR